MLLFPTALLFLQLQPDGGFILVGTSEKIADYACDRGVKPEGDIIKSHFIENYPHLHQP